MKILHVLIAFLVMLFAPVVLLASDGSDPVGLSNIFASFLALVAAIPLVTELIKKVIKTDNKLANQIISWGCGFTLTFLGWYLHLGFLDGLLWYYALIIGLFASLASNGVYDTQFYSWLLNNLGIVKPPKK